MVFAFGHCKTFENSAARVDNVEEERVSNSENVSRTLYAHYMDTWDIWDYMVHIIWTLFLRYVHCTWLETFLTGGCNTLFSGVLSPLGRTERTERTEVLQLRN